MLVYTYLVYVSLSAMVTVWVGTVLSRNGRVFLVENFRGNETLADSVNHLLQIGFYLVNFGFVSLALRFGTKPHDLVSAIEFLSTKVGLVIVVLGIMHFFNMSTLVKFRDSKLFHKVIPDGADPAPAGAQAVERSTWGGAN